MKSRFIVTGVILVVTSALLACGEAPMVPTVTPTPIAPSSGPEGLAKVNERRAEYGLGPMDNVSYCGIQANQYKEGCQPYQGRSSAPAATPTPVVGAEGPYCDRNPHLKACQPVAESQYQASETGQDASIEALEARIADLEGRLAQQEAETVITPECIEVRRKAQNLRPEYRGPLLGVMGCELTQEEKMQIMRRQIQDLRAEQYRDLPDIGEHYSDYVPVPGSRGR